MIIDLHCDTLLYLNKETDLKSAKGHISLDKLIEGKYLLQCFAIFTHLKYVKNPKEFVYDKINTFYENMDKFQDYIKPIKTYQDIIDNKQNGKISALLSIEELGCINSVEELVDLYNKGVRMATLTWNFDNPLGSPSCLGNNGLTPLGIEAIKKMEELGIVIDVSHLSDQGVYDILKHTTKPFIASHSNVRSLCDIPRNLPDELLLEMKKRGCIIGMNYYPQFVIKDSNVLKIDDLIKHIDYLKDLIGIDHVALGSDFDGIDGELEIKDASYLPLLISKLKEHGYSDEDINKITHQNALNLFSKIL